MLYILGLLVLASDSLTLRQLVPDIYEGFVTEVERSRGST